VIVDYIEAHRDRFGVEPICRVLSEHGITIAPSSYYAARARPPSPRAVRDEAVLAEIIRLHIDPDRGRGLYGARKVYHQLRRQGGVEGQPVARCTVERLMRKAGLRGARRGRPFRTTRPDATAQRPPDLVKRDFHANAPNCLWVVDFTYSAQLAVMCSSVGGPLAVW
jgi:putative transposase